MRFEFATATRIIFGEGALREVTDLARAMRPTEDTRILVVTGGSGRRAEPLLDDLDQAGIACDVFSVSGEPTIETATRGRDLAADRGCALVVSVGGGSVIDAGKAIAALLTNPGDPLTYLEVIGPGQAIANRSAPFIAVPTTAGTGAEVTKNAVLASPENRVKVSLRSALMLPRVAVVDPELTCELPPHLTAGTGLDALTQLIEPFVCTRANPMTDALCRYAIPLAAAALPRAFDDPQDAAARHDMALASLFGGLALANAGLGAVHGLAGPIGGMFPAPHGQVCAILLPHVLETNLRALRKRRPDNPVLSRFDELGRLLTGRAGCAADDAVSFVKDLCARLDIGRLADYGLTSENISVLVEKASAASSMKPNPIGLTEDELTGILAAAL